MRVLTTIGGDKVGTRFICNAAVIVFLHLQLPQSLRSKPKSQVEKNAVLGTNGNEGGAIAGFEFGGSARGRICHLDKAHF